MSSWKMVSTTICISLKWIFNSVNIKHSILFFTSCIILAVTVCILLLKTTGRFRNRTQCLGQNGSLQLRQRVQEIKVNQTGNRQSRTEHPEIFGPGARINLSTGRRSTKQNMWSWNLSFVNILRGLWKKEKKGKSWGSQRKREIMSLTGVSIV